jgi:hypothetical protein
MGRESSSSLYSFTSKRCACDLFLSNLEKNSCCRDESEFIILDEDQTVAQVLSLDTPEYYSLGELYQLFSLQVQNRQTEVFVNPIDNGSPPKEPLYKLYCRLTLYEAAC